MSFLLYLLFFGYVFASVSGFFADEWWVLDLFTHFKFQYLWLGFLLLPLFSWYRRIWMSLVVAVLILFHASAVGHILFSGPVAVFKPLNSVRIMSSNIKYDRFNLTAVLAAVNQVNPDVLIVYEVQPQEIDVLRQQLTNLPYVYTISAIGAFDITLFARNNLIISAVEQLSSSKIPFLVSEVRVNDEHTIQVIGVHPYPPMSKYSASARDQYLEQVLKEYGNSNHPTVIVGDFNATNFSQPLQKLMTEYSWIDTQQQFGLQPSWPSWLPAFMRIPIDHAVVNDSVTVYNRWLGPDIDSDHLPVVIDVGVN